MNEIIFKIKDLIDNIPDKILPEHLFIRGEKDGFQVGFIVKEISASIERILSNLYKRNDDITSVFYSISSGTNSPTPGRATHRRLNTRSERNPARRCREARRDRTRG